MDVNLAVYKCTAACLVGRAAWPFGLEKRMGRILNISIRSSGS